jgi:hypothetical protein
VDEGPSKPAEPTSSRPPVRDVVPLVKAVPPVIMVDVDPSLPADLSNVRDATINQSPHIAMSRAKSAVTSKDMDDYSIAHTKDVHYLLTHSLMRVKVIWFFFFLSMFSFVSYLIVGFL